MTLAETIKRAFAHRKKPAQVNLATDVTQLDSDVEEALWFSGRDRDDLTCRDWREHSCAIYFFDREAFAYYLPSVLILSAENPNEDLQAADQIISELDQTPDPAVWTDGLVRRFGLLNTEELEALKLWLLQVCDYVTYKGSGISGSGAGDRLARAFDTLTLLQQESGRTRLADR